MNKKIDLLNCNIFLGVYVLFALLCFIVVNVLMFEFVELIPFELIKPLLSMAMWSGFVIVWILVICFVYDCFVDYMADKKDSVME